jgi:hypothetical protein
MVKGYFSYLLRLWQAGAGPEAAWHASVEVISTGERRAFVDLDSLLAYLREQTRANSLLEDVDGGRDSTPDPAQDAQPPGGEQD